MSGGDGQIQGVTTISFWQFAVENGDKFEIQSDGPGKIIVAVVVIMALWGGSKRGK